MTYTCGYFHNTDDISDRKDALLDILPGLQADGDTPVPLKSINVIASLVDVAAEVMSYNCCTCIIASHRSTNF